MHRTGPVFARTRIAPTPSGFLHLGNVLSFALTAALAQQTGAKILLRIDDLDRDRVNAAYVQDIFDTLNFLEIPWDEGPANYNEYQREWSQIHRMDHYNDVLQRLKSNHQVFACECTRSQLQSKEIYPGTCRKLGLDFGGENVNWRLDTSEKRKLHIRTLTDGILNAELPASMHDFVIRKKDGFPAYQLSSVVDDVYFGVDLIVRGVDLWHSTLAQHYLAHELKADAFFKSTFHHHPLLLETGDKKLSKSAGSTSVKYLREQGKEPADIYQAILIMCGITVDLPPDNWKRMVELINQHGQLSQND